MIGMPATGISAAEDEPHDVAICSGITERNTDALAMRIVPVSVCQAGISSRELMRDYCGGHGAIYKL